MDVELHRYYTKYLQSSEALNSLISVFAKFTREHIILEKVSLAGDEHVIGLLNLCHRITFFASTRTLFGDIEPRLLEDDFTTFDANIHFFIALLPTWIYPWLWRRELEARERLNRSWLLYHRHPMNESEFIRRRATFICNHPEWFTESDFAGAQTAILWASLGNTIPAIFWCLYYLLRNPIALKTVREEIVSKLSCTNLSFNTDELDIQGSKDALDQCIYLDSAVNETLRMVSTPMTLRKCSRTTKIALQDGRTFEVKQGDAIALFPAAAHRDPHFFEEPNVYKYDRFVHQQVLTGFVPFGVGKSMCPGRSFARNAIKLCIAFVLRNIQCTFVDSTYPEPTQKVHRIGIGIAPPTYDPSIRYRYVD
ncbi:unnamed protein product [Rotaria sp. Silwood1]|nr:unnamed protein product [Rotaria sp. Silwood1]